MINKRRVLVAGMAQAVSEMIQNENARAATTQRLEEDIIVPGRSRVMEGGGLGLTHLSPPTPAPTPGQCMDCGTVISKNKIRCRACVNFMLAKEA